MSDERPRYEHPTSEPITSEETIASHHVESIPVYATILVVLLLLTALTVWVGFQDLGNMNLLVALGIAAVKATLVILWFMHARQAGAVTWLFIGAGFFWLAILVAITIADYVSRGWIPVPGGWA